MNSNFKRAVSMIVATALVVAFGHEREAAAAAVEVSDTITIATGKVGGIYHPVGGAICKLVNEKTAEHGISCTIEITGGSAQNINELRQGKADLAMAQSDTQYSAFKGIGGFQEAGPFQGMRFVFAPYVEQFTLVARDDADINSFQDLKGKRVYIGPPGAGKRETMQVVMEAFGWTHDDFQDVTELTASNVAEALCDNEIDAFVYTIGHPSPMVSEAMDACRAVIAPVSGRAIERLAKRSPIYVSTVIPKDTYQGQNRDIPTVGLVATVLTTESTSPEVIYQVTKAFFENLDRLREASPLFRSLTTREMVTSGKTAPVHEGAARYYAEAGLQKDNTAKTGR